MDVSAAAPTGPDPAQAARAREDEAVAEERRAGNASVRDAQADPGPRVGKVVDISA